METQEKAKDRAPEKVKEKAPEKGGEKGKERAPEKTPEKAPDKDIKYFVRVRNTDLDGTRSVQIALTKIPGHREDHGTGHLPAREGEPPRRHGEA